MPRVDSVRARAWRLFDELSARQGTGSNPWMARGAALAYRPDLEFLGVLLAVPVVLDATTQSGVPALALDVWVSYELRRSGFAADDVWPRTSAPRVLPREVAALLASLPRSLQRQIRERLHNGTNIAGVAGAEAKVLGKHYIKQVDVVMSAWDTGPQVMISTKRMDAALGKNAANRVEESYGDARNLRARHPRSALGFVYSLREEAAIAAPQKTDWLVDLLGKLGEQDDAYDAVALIVPILDRAPARGAARSTATEEPDEGGDALADAGLVPVAAEAGTPAQLSAGELAELLDALEPVALNTAAVPAPLAPSRFFEVIVGRILDASPITMHSHARRLRATALGGV